MLDIGLEIKILRERLKVSSKDLAQKIGLSQSQMSRLEKGQRRIDTTVLHRIAEALGVDPAFFFRQSAAASELRADAAPATASSIVSSEEAKVAAGIATTVPAIRHEHLGKLIRSERRKRHLTVDELATKVGRTKAYVTALEEGKHALEPDLADRISRVLRLSPHFFLEAQQQAITALEKQVARLDQALAEAHRDAGGAGGRAGVPHYGDLAAGLQLAFEAGEYPVGEPDEFLILPGLEGERCFALSVSGDAMESAGQPSFREGDVVVFGSGVPRSRDFVLAKLEDESLLFRQVFFEPDGSVRLQPLNLEWGAYVGPRKSVRSVWRLAMHVART